MSPFDIDPARLRQRTSAKWRAFPEDVWPAWVAELDVELAEPVRAVLADAIARSDTGYLFPADLPRALTGFLERSQSWSVDPARVMVLADVLTGIAQSLAVLTPPNPGVVITTPVYPPFFSTVTHVARGRVVEVPLLRTETGWAYDLDGLDTALARDDVHALLLSHPHNPTGLIADVATMQRIGEQAARHGVLVISDEIHGPLTHPGVSFTPYLAAVPDEAHAVAAVSATKGWNIAGLKCAQLIAGSEAVREQLEAGVPNEARYGAGHLGVLATIAAYDHGESWLDEVRAVIASNARTLESLLADQLPDAGYVVPDASYLAWIDLRAYGGGDDPAAVILERSRLAVSSGPTFGELGRGWIRLNIGTSPEQLPMMVNRIASAVRP